MPNVEKDPTDLARLTVTEKTNVVKERHPWPVYLVTGLETSATTRIDSIAMAIKFMCFRVKLDLSS